MYRNQWIQYLCMQIIKLLLEMPVKRNKNTALLNIILVNTNKKGIQQQDGFVLHEKIFHKNNWPKN